MLSDLHDLYRERERKGFDTAQVCLNGHFINSTYVAFPEFNKAFCNKCGKATITTCQNCQAPIQGEYHDSLGFGFQPPSRCHACGAMYPWTSGRRDAALELVDELTLSSAEKEELKQSIQDLIEDGPRTRLAIVKFNKLVSKGGEW